MSLSVSDVLVTLARHLFELFHDPAGEAWAWDGADALRIGSSAFAERLSREHWESTGKAPSQTQVATASTTLRGIAKWDGPEFPVGLRIAGHEGRVLVDLADPERHVVVIGPQGWSVTTDSPVRFRRPPGIGPLPHPVPGGSLDELEQLWPIRGEDFVLVMGWVLGCFNPWGSKPLLDLSGTQGSGKSLLAHMIRGLIDPHASPLQTMPTTLRDLAVVASHHALPLFDNVSLIPDELSDALCRLATGGGFETRKLYTDDELATFSGIRPVILTGIPEAARQPDLVDRTINVTLPVIGPGERLTEAEILAEFDPDRPLVLGVLFDAVACALRNLPTTVPREDPRMLDFATWVQAGSPVFGWEPDRFLDAYLANRSDASAGIIEGSFIGQFIPRLADRGFTGTATDCLRELALLAEVEATRRRGWAATPKGLAGILRRLAPSLAEVGIVIEFLGPTGHDRHRTIRIHRASDASASGGDVLPFAKPAAGEDRLVQQVLEALRAIGVEATWPPSKAARLALAKAAGDTAIAVRALNAMGLVAPDGLTWTADKLRGVV